jgi:hypothetical protein
VLIQIRTVDPSKRRHEQTWNASVSGKLAIPIEHGPHVYPIPATKGSFPDLVPEVAFREGSAATAERIILQRMPDTSNFANRKEPIVIAEQLSQDRAPTSTFAPDIED